MNRTLPKVTPPDTELRLSANPTKAELLKARLSGEPLVPIGGEPDAAENLALVTAMLRHDGDANSDEPTALSAYVAAHPRGKWTASVLNSLATDYLNNGYYSRAIETWKQAWSLAKTAAEPKARSIADRAGAELALMYARFGRIAELEALLKEFDGRTIVGSTTEMLYGARQGLWTMQNQPHIAFRCGPLALDRIRGERDPKLLAHAYIMGAHATTNGYSLTQLQQLSRDLGMFYQMAFRTNGARIIFPAVAHWKAGHYAAIVREEAGRYVVQDPTFRDDVRMARRALDEESSGYFLVPAGALPRGWRAVTDAEGSRIWGKGPTNDNDPDSTNDEDKKKDDCPGAMGLATYNVHLMLVSLNITDTPVGYRPPVGSPIYFTVTYNHREASQPANFYYSNLGPKWTFNWLGYIRDNPSAPSANAYYSGGGGGTLPYSGFDTNSQTYAPQLKNQTRLRRLSSTSYETLYPDGSRRVYGQPDGSSGTSRRIFLTQMIDPYGNTVQLSYDANLRVVAITDAIGQVTTLRYEHPTDIYKITRVTDPFGRFTTFEYDGLGRLFRITDVNGLTSSFSYQEDGDFIQVLTTPYGSTRFARGETGRTRWLQVTDPQGQTERIEFTESAQVGVPATESKYSVPGGMLLDSNWMYTRNSFYWDKFSYIQAKGDYTKARVYHWLHSTDYQMATGILESEKAPLENRIWYNYPNQPVAIMIGATAKPIKVGRVLDDGTTQLYQYSYNPLGRMTESVDPVGRRMTYVYSTNDVDLLEIRQTTGTSNDLIASISYDHRHLPLYVTDAAGQTTTNAYNARGQLVATTNALGYPRTFTYDTNGYLLAVDGPLPGTNDTISFAYDSIGRLQIITDVDGYMLNYAYDNLDRLTNVNYLDGTFEAFTFDKLDRVAACDRMGRVTRYTYNALRQCTSATDPLDRTNRFDYCDCGSLTALTDAMGRTTRWHYDVQGRLAAKEYADGSRILYTYEKTTSRLKSICDEKGQYRLYDYYLDNNRHQVSYPNAILSTPMVTYTYDANYSRLKTMQDGIGFTSYSYHPVGVLGAGQPSSVDGPWDNDTITYFYDQVGRATNRAINGIAESTAYDVAGRITNVVNALGTFRYAYDGPTRRLLDVFYPNGQTSHYEYLGNVQDRRLRRLTHLKPDATILSRFTYGYTPHGSVTNWLQELGAYTEAWAVSYDAADQLTNVVSSTSTGTTNTTYAYDKVGNRVSKQVGTNRSDSYYNVLNELTKSTDVTFNHSTYEWDSEQRLISISSGISRTELSYDGLGRLYRITETTNGLLVNAERFVWYGLYLAERRGNHDMPTIRFYSQGEQQQGVSIYYTHDHLGSVRELTYPDASLGARYSYDSFGNMRKLFGELDASFAFTGHMLHQRSQLLMAPYRVYSSSTARWLSRDPLPENLANLYSYVGNNPVNLVDLFGLEGLPPGWPPIPPRFADMPWKFYPNDADSLLGKLRAPSKGKRGGGDELVFEPPRELGETGYWKYKPFKRPPQRYTPDGKHPLNPYEAHPGRGLPSCPRSPLPSIPWWQSLIDALKLPGAGPLLILPFPPELIPYITDPMYEYGA